MSWWHYNCEMVCINFELVGVIPCSVALANSWQMFTHEGLVVFHQTQTGGLISVHQKTSSPCTNLQLLWKDLSSLISHCTSLFTLSALIGYSLQEKKKRGENSVVQCDKAFLGQVAALGVTRHFWHLVGCSAEAEQLCSQRLPVRIRAVQLLCPSQLTKTWTTGAEVDLSEPLCTISHSQTHSLIHTHCVCRWFVSD